MPPKRRAVIVASASPSERASIGVDADTSLWNRFLTSDFGGAWSQEEIVSLQNPLKKNLQHILREPEYDFTLFAFSGHGSGVMQEGEMHTFLLLNEIEREVDLEQLFPASRRQMIILDTCRHVEIISEGLTKVASVRLQPLVSIRQRERCKDLFWDAMQNAEGGRSILFGCGFHQYAEADRNGGLFTRHLISESRHWAESMTDFLSEGREDTGERILSIRDAFKLAQNALSIRQAIQTPEGCFGRRRVHFPFGVVREP